MTRYINREKGNTGEWCIPGAVLEDGAEKNDNLQKTILSKERNKVYAKQQDGRYHFVDISLFNANESAEDARCIMVEFAAPFVPGFEPRRLEVLTSILPEHVVYNDQALLKRDFCDLATYARAEGREDADTVELEPAMLVCHVDGRFGLNLKMRMVEL
jgi:hypothetical protein